MSSTAHDPKYFLRSENPESDAPTLGLVQSFWALTQREVTLEQALEDAYVEGYRYFEAGLLVDRIERIKSLLYQFPMQLIAQGWAVNSEEAIPFLDRAAELGAIAINLHLGHAFMSVDESADLLASVQDAANQYAIPLMIETHRGRFTQDLLRTNQILRRLPETVLTLDVSHYIVAGEGLGGSPELFYEIVKPLLARTALLHGRISNAQSIQVSLEDSFAFTSQQESLWQQTMELWLDDAPSTAVFLFEPELGPPPYAYLQHGTETFSRTNETRVLSALAQRAWARATEKSAARMGVAG